MLKYIVLILIVLSILELIFYITKKATMKKTEINEITSEIHSMNIKINAADFIIVHGRNFLVESNIKNLSVFEKDGVLTVFDETKYAANYAKAIFKLWIPNYLVFENVDITTGAGRLTADSLSANSLKLKLGAGKVELGELNANSIADIVGGAGEITVSSGALNNLTLSLGAGKLNMTAALNGKSDLKFGVGQSDLTLIGNKNNYNLDIVKGIGSITVDERIASDIGSSLNGQHHISIKGGIGATNIGFKEK